MGVELNAQLLSKRRLEGVAVSELTNFRVVLSGLEPTMGEHFSIVLPNATCNGDGCRYERGGGG